MFRGFFALVCLVAFQYSAAAAGFRCTVAADEPFLNQANRFILAGLSYEPVEATQAGYHGDGNRLDTELDDASPATIAAQRVLLVEGKQCFARVRASSPEDGADLVLLRDSIEANLFALDVLQGYRYRPQDYVEMIGSGLFFPLTSTDGTEQTRLTAVLSRMEKVPRILEEARQNLKEADPVFLDTALDENAGNTSVIEQIGGMIPAGSPLRARYESASKAARYRSTVTTPGSRTTWPIGHTRSPGEPDPPSTRRSLLLRSALAPMKLPTPCSPPRSAIYRGFGRRCTRWPCRCTSNGFRITASTAI